jgi:hypothetical protein
MYHTRSWEAYWISLFGHDSVTRIMRPSLGRPLVHTVQSRDRETCLYLIQEGHKATYMREYKYECARTHVCIDPSTGQQSPVIRDSPLAIQDSSVAMRRQRPIMQYYPSFNAP